MALNTASYGSFARLSASQGERLIENLAQSYQCDAEMGRSSRADDYRLKEVNEKIEELKRVCKAAMVRIKKKDQFEESVWDRQEEVHFVQAGYVKGYSPRWPQQELRQGLYQDTNSGPPIHDPQSSREAENNMLLRKILEGQETEKHESNTRFFAVNSKIHEMYEVLTEKYKHLASHVKDMDQKIVEQASQLRVQKGRLPGKCEVNPKELCHPITLRSGKQLPPRTREDLPKDDEEEVIEIPLEDTKEDEQKADKPIEPKEAPKPRGEARILSS